MSNLETTRAIIDAYLAADLPGVLEHLADDIEWEHGSVSDVPWYRARKGKVEVAEFFASLADVEFLQWEPKLFLGEGDLALVVIDSDYRVKKLADG